MQESQNTTLVQNIYAAFGRGDIQTLLDGLDEQIVWRPVIGASSSVPTAGNRRGKAAVGEFFRTLSETSTFEDFQTNEFVAQGDKVVVIGRYTGTAKATGRQYRSEWTMVFTLKNGKVVEFREFTDTAALNAAWEGAPVRV